MFKKLLIIFLFIPYSLVLSMQMSYDAYISRLLSTRPLMEKHYEQIGLDSKEKIKQLCGLLDIEKGRSVLSNTYELGKKIIDAGSESVSIAFLTLKYPNEIFNIEGWYETFQVECESLQPLRSFEAEFRDIGQRYYELLLQYFCEKNHDKPDLIDSLQKEVSEFAPPKFE